MNLDELRAFLAVAESGSILAAADNLGLPRTTLRRRLDDLEARVGAPLFFRGTQGANLTAAGELVAGRARRILEEANVLLSSVRDLGNAASGTVRVVVPVGMPIHAMVPIFQTCRLNYPQLSLDIRVLEDPLSALSENVDLVIHFGARVSSGPWVSRVLLQVRQELVGSVSYFEAHGIPEKIEDLKDHTLFSWSGPGMDPQLLPLNAGGTVRIEPVLVTSDVHAMRQLMILGEGIAFLPNGALPDPDIEPDFLRVVLPDLIGRDCPARVVVPEPMARSPKIRALQTSILNYLGDS